MARYLRKGDKRLEGLKEQLLREGQKKLTRAEKQALERLRSLCKKRKKDYVTQRNAGLPPNSENMLTIGEDYDFPDVGDQVLGKCKVVSTTARPSSMNIEMLDPLRTFVYTVENAKEALKPGNGQYLSRQYEYEREAYLYGSTPPSLIKAFYKEMVAYTEALAERSMARPDPYTTSFSQPYQNIADYAVATQQRFLLDNVGLDYLIKTHQENSIIPQINNAIDTYPFHHHTGPNEIRFALNHLIKLGIKVKEANLLIAKLADKNNDGLEACRFYHRAFKQGADFELEDYTSCLENLMENQKWGEAKVICQKALQRYRRDYNNIPQGQPATREYFQLEYLDVMMRWQEEIKMMRRRRIDL